MSIVYKTLIVFSLCSCLLLAGPYDEPSVYTQEQAQYDPNVKLVQNNQSDIVRLKQENSELRQDIEGLKSLIEGLSGTVNDMRQADMSKASAPQPSSNVDPSLVQNLGVMIDKINGDYVSKDELARALQGQRTAYAPKTTTPSTPSSQTSNYLKNAPSNALFSRGVRLVGQHKYSMAKQRFDILRSRGYKKASTYYYSGEVAYRQGKYSDAIGYYKTSARSNDKANYMPTLLLHTGISMEKTGQKSQAKNFFKAIIDSYPGTYSAKEAKKRL